MTDPRPGENGGQIPEAGYRDPEAQLGGADAVEKTTYVTGRGTSPEARSPVGIPSARTPASGWRTPLIWIVLVVVVLLAITYLGGIL